MTVACHHVTPDNRCGRDVSRAHCRWGGAAYPTGANEPTGILEQGSWRQARDRWGSALVRTTGAHHRCSGSSLTSCRRCVASRRRQGRLPRSCASNYAEAGYPVRSQRGRRNFVDRQNRDNVGRLGGRTCTAIRTYLFQTETIRYREISCRKRLHDGRLLPHYRHRAVERVVSVVIRTQRRELRDACAVYHSLPGWKPYADFRHRAGRGCSLGTGLCVRIFGKTGEF